MLAINEKERLGTFIISSKDLRDEILKSSEDDFKLRNNKFILRAIKSLCQYRSDVSMMSVCVELERMNLLGIVGIEYVKECHDSAISRYAANKPLNIRLAIGNMKFLRECIDKGILNRQMLEEYIDDTMDLLDNIDAKE